MPAVMPGMMRNETPGPREVERFFTAPAEHERVAALEPQHAPPFPGQRDQPLGDIALCGRQLAAALSWRTRARPAARRSS